MDQTQIIFQGTYSYRKRSVGIVSVIMTFVFIPVFIFLAVAFFSTPVTLETVTTFLFVGGISGLMGFCGVWLLHAYLTHKTLELRITPEGVSYGGKNFPWSEVGWLSAKCTNGVSQLFLQRRGWMAIDRNLMTDDGISPGEYQRLMLDLEQIVGSIHNHLEFT